MFNGSNFSGIPNILISALHANMHTILYILQITTIGQQIVFFLTFSVVDI